ncbi:protocadherin Fat 4-like [Pogoniulus pusillus]|uniref:protocadherin Fat 4-like n=1 Tax=Pogoniulus pusillus TaxID=488313 RepID=UPI0030B9463D
MNIIRLDTIMGLKWLLYGLGALILEKTMEQEEGIVYSSLKLGPSQLNSCCSLLRAGDIEWITNIPPDARLKLKEYIFPDHLPYVDLIYSPGSTNATVRTKMALDVDALQNDHLFYAVVCQRIGTINEIENGRLLALEDINDNSPEFLQTHYSASISEVSEINFVVIKVEAVDKDYSPWFRLLTYSLWGPNSDYFYIREGDGNIMVNKTLDYNKINLFNLTVQAKETFGNNSATASLLIHIEDYDTLNPYFTQPVYYGKISENKLGPLSVLPEKIMAKDGDVGINEKVVYSIKLVDPPAYRNTVSFNEDTEELEVKTAIDREECPYLVVGIQAAQQDNILKTTDSVVLVTIEDVNDNPPVFSQSSYNVSILENFPNGMEVLQLTATDKDEGGFNGTFILTSADSPFQLSQSGILTVRNSTLLDRERMPSIHLEVLAIDAEINGLTSSALFHITVLDVNDNNPEFQMQPYSFVVPEGAYTPGTPARVGQVTATDLDEGQNAQITYYLSSEDEDNPYSIQQNGTIVVNGYVDRETRDKYELLVVASDNGVPQRQNFTYVSIQVLDVNDNPPRFTKAQYSASVRVATAEEGASVISVSATDLDIGNNSVITYSLSSHSDDFHINNRTGDIILSSNLDHITADTVVTLTVFATDHGVPPLTSNASVTLYLLVNDTSFRLTFDSPSYSFSIQENEPSGTPVGFVKALTGSIAVQVVYSLKSHTDKFFVGDQGDIVALVKLDREEEDLYSIIVEAVDSVVPPNTALALVTVRVNDVNDNPPVFSALTPTKLSAPENAANLDLGVFPATDLDTGVNALITYSLQDDFAGMFYVNNSTGKLMTKRSLDREMMDSYELKIIATDSGKPPQYASLVVSITVEDENDNPPVFPQKLYSATVKENEPPHVILSAAATDEDIGYNAIIHYTITAEPYLFHVGELSGNITVLQPLDYESHSQYTFILKAFNPGEPYMQDTANITVTVEDVNEEAPVFDKPSYYQILLDNSTAGTLVVDINARDESKGYDEDIFYNISGMLEIDLTGAYYWSTGMLFS